jgi:hypothetical protein
MMKGSYSARRATIVAVSAGLLAVSALAAPAATTLEDQYGRAVEVRVGAGAPVVAVVSDLRAAAEEIAAWDKALVGLPAGTVQFRIADLKALPFFVPRGAVTKDLRDKYSGVAMLLDWKGAASESLRAPRKTTAVLAFGPDGSELGRVEGAASAVGAAKIKDLLARLR